MPIHQLKKVLHQLNFFGYIALQMEAIERYLSGLEEDRRTAMQQLLETAQQHLPAGFELQIQYNMPTFVVPLSYYPPGYHCAVNTPLPFISMASQKNFIAVYHMGIYGSKDLLDWFVAEYPKHVSSKLDMGKSCIRFKKMEHIPYSLFAQLFEKISPNDWIELYEKNYKPKNR